MLWTSVHSSSCTLSDLVPWICLVPSLYNHKGYDLDHTWRHSDFPYFLQSEPEFCNKEFVIWAVVSSRACFCRLYRASPLAMLCLVAQPSPTLCNPLDCSSPGSSVHRILQARILEWVAMPSCRGSSQPRDRMQVSCIAGRILPSEPPGKPNLWLQKI